MEREEEQLAQQVAWPSKTWKRMITMNLYGKFLNNWVFDLGYVVYVLGWKSVVYVCGNNNEPKVDFVDLLNLSPQIASSNFVST